jgi:hypothetical protein
VCSFFTDPDGIWLDLCRDDDLAKRRCVTFLTNYVQSSKVEFPILVPLEQTAPATPETETRQTVTSANSLLNVWRSLIAEADRTVLLARRKEDPKNKSIWRLKFMDHTNSKGNGPVYEVSKVTFLYLVVIESQSYLSSPISNTPV